MFTVVYVLLYLLSYQDIKGNSPILNGYGFVVSIFLTKLIQCHSLNTGGRLNDNTK